MIQIMSKLTFKSFLKEESNYRHIAASYEGHKLSHEEILALPEPAPANFESQYRVGGVFFDNNHGLGAVPDNRNVEYKGFVGFITPKQFLELAANHQGKREESAADIKQAISDGFPIGAPFLDITLSDIEEGGYATVVGHEGRARCLALIALGRDKQMGFLENTKIPVHFFLRDGLRSRHITDEMIASLKNSGIIPEDQKKKNPKEAEKLKVLKEIYINGKKIEL